MLKARIVQNILGKSSDDSLLLKDFFGQQDQGRHAHNEPVAWNVELFLLRNVVANMVGQSICGGEEDITLSMQRRGKRRGKGILGGVYHLPRKHYPINSENFKPGNGNKKEFDKDRTLRQVMSCNSHKCNRYWVSFSNSFEKSQIG